MSWIWFSIFLGGISVAVSQLETVVISHPDFTFDKYPTLQSMDDVQAQPHNIAPGSFLYYSHVFGSLRSTVRGNLTQVKYLPTSIEPFDLQIWKKYSNGSLLIESAVTVVPSSADSINTYTLPTRVEVDVDNLIGLWIPITYPVGTLKNPGQAITDYWITYGGYSSKAKPNSAAAATEEERVTSTTGLSIPRSYLPALEITAEYDSSSQPTTTTPLPTTTTTATTTTTTTTTTATTTTTSDTVITASEVSTPSVNTTSSSIATTAAQPSTTNRNLSMPASTSTKSPTPTKPLSSGVTAPSGGEVASTKSANQSVDVGATDRTKTGVVWEGELLIIVIVAPTAAFIVLLIMVSTVLCVRFKQRRIEKTDRLKKSYLAGANSIHDYEISETYRYPNPMSNSAYQNDEHVNHSDDLESDSRLQVSSQTTRI